MDSSRELLDWAVFVRLFQVVEARKIRLAGPFSVAYPLPELADAISGGAVSELQFVVCFTSASGGRSDASDIVTSRCIFVPVPHNRSRVYSVFLALFRTQFHQVKPAVFCLASHRSKVSSDGRTVFFWIAPMKDEASRPLLRSIPREMIQFEPPLRLPSRFLAGPTCASRIPFRSLVLPDRCLFFLPSILVSTKRCDKSLCATYGVD